MMPKSRPKVILIGGGFAGLHAAMRLAGRPIDVTLVDRRNHHLFQPLLYQVATAGLSPTDIAEPIRRILSRAQNVTVLMEAVESIDPASRSIRLSGGRDIGYDFLIVATGVTHSYFGRDDWSHLAPGLKTIEDALEIRRRVLNAFEQAENEADPQVRQEWLTFVVIGGGPTGSELAGALSEIARHTLLKDFRNFEPRDARVVLLEGGSRILSMYPEELSSAALIQLGKLGVDVWINSFVTEISEREVSIGDRRLRTRTVLWAAGVSASPLGQYLGENQDRAGRVLVSPDLSVTGHPEVFVAGDLAALSQDGKEIPGVAPAAIQQGRSAAGNILRILEGKTPRPFRYVDRGSMATLGRSSAVATIRRLRLTGFPAWLAWLTIHIYFLIGFRNRLVVLIEWARSYFTYQRSARLIINEPQAEPARPVSGPPPGDSS